MKDPHGAMRFQRSQQPTRNSCRYLRRILHTVLQLRRFRERRMCASHSATSHLSTTECFHWHEEGSHRLTSIAPPTTREVTAMLSPSPLCPHAIGARLSSPRPEARLSPRPMLRLVALLCG